jgi:hypothetical protein
MDQWTVKWSYQCTPDDGRVTAETCRVNSTKYENKKFIRWLKKLKIVKMHGEQNVKLSVNIKQKNIYACIICFYNVPTIYMESSYLEGSVRVIFSVIKTRILHISALIFGVSALHNCISLLCANCLSLSFPHALLLYHLNIRTS